MPKVRHRILLAFDFGMKSIGVAVGQVITQTASPLLSLRARDGIPDWNEIKKLIDQWQVDGLIVGVPYNKNGIEQELTKAAKKFSRRLTAYFQLPVYCIDEQFTSTEAKSELFNQKKQTEVDKAMVDSYAAKLILQSWFHQQTEHSNND